MGIVPDQGKGKGNALGTTQSKTNNALALSIFDTPSIKLIKSGDSKWQGIAVKISLNLFKNYSDTKISNANKTNWYYKS